MGARLIIIRYCCGKQCARAPLNRFLIRDLHHKLHLLCHLPLSSVIDDKIRPPTSFSIPCRKKISTPPPRLSTPPPKEKCRPPTSFWTIRTLGRTGVVLRRVLSAFSSCIYWPAILVFPGRDCSGRSPEIQADRQRSVCFPTRKRD